MNMDKRLFSSKYGFSRMPDSNILYVNNATRILEKRRELAEVEEDLINQREEFHVKLRVLKQRREDLLEKEEELKLSILKFDKFLKENDAKRLRAKSKQMSESDQQRQKEREIITMEKELDFQITQRGKLKEKTETHAMYPSFLENVIKTGDKFQDIRTVTTRFEALLHTYDLLVRKYQENQETIKTIKSNLHNFIKTKNNENMKYQNMIAGLKIRLEAAKTKTVKWESIWVHIQNTAARKTLTLGMVKMAIFNLYAHIKEAELDLNIAIEDTTNQLSVVHEYILQLREILHEFRKWKVSLPSAALKE
ncbi:coiled-coil domain-containing protein 42 homolog isoform X2 [Leucoraja erinacea]|uniref:coiled-coil domain-containing protein 42 homolog isoform X2 n=1 Tax=Leucoraja erinaceus TaxID=7782 RepID=UPI0024569895|nr:coiled-coil domain-containing protein 42 homolog isoform X2 [Leucoraja erinacea]